MAALTATTSLQHQSHVIELSKDKPYFGLLMEQGTGKTHVTLATMVHLWRERKITAMIVLAPNGVHTNWAVNEIPLHVPEDVKQVMNILTWESGMGIKKRAVFDWTISNSADNLLVILANIEAVRTPAFAAAIRPMLSRKILMVVDEATVIKNPKAMQSKKALALAKYGAYSRILTGTPITQGPLDLWSQCQFLSPQALPYPSFTSFKLEFAIEKEMILGNRHFRKTVGYRNLEKLAQLIAPFTYRVMKKDCLDLPEKIYQRRYVELTEEQLRIYKQLLKECLAEINGQLVTTTTVLTAMLRLHTVALGYVTTDDRVMQAIPSNRIKVLLELYEEMQGKAIIFCRFKEDVRQVVEALTEVGRMPCQYHGDVPDWLRASNIKVFQEGDATDFVATSAAARGLTLHAAENVIYYSQGFSLETRLQSEDRAHRIGQKKNVLYTDLIAKGTIDERVIEALRNKQELASMVLERKDVEQLQAMLEL